MIDKLTLSNCGDKGVSVGERTNASIENMFIKNSNIGLASKDSSIVDVENAFIKKLKFCISAYNKKDEFDGGRISVNKLKCENFDHKIVKDGYSFINIKHELIVRKKFILDPRKYEMFVNYLYNLKAKSDT